VTRFAPRANDDLACVLLAAGGSRRFGTAKQLARYRGRTLLAHAVEAARRALPRAPLVVVVGADALRLMLVVRRMHRNARVVVNQSWAQGMATSLRAGVAAVPPGARAALVLLVDQPRVDAAALRRLIAAWRRRPEAPAAARYAGQTGVPAILPRRGWRALRALTGDEGARRLLRDGRVTLVELPEAAFDVDTPADLLALSAGAAA
jgi:molybdenum cofactor cytidylyltransferase